MEWTRPVSGHTRGTREAKIAGVYCRYSSTKSKAGPSPRSLLRLEGEGEKKLMSPLHQGGSGEAAPTRAPEDSKISASQRLRVDRLWKELKYRMQKKKETVVATGE